MAAVLELFERLGDELIDPNFVRWTKETHLRNLNDAISSILVVRPDLGRVTAEVELAANSMRAQLPPDAYKLIGVNHVNGYALQFVDIFRLNQNYPQWRMMKDPQPTNWTRQENDDLSFYVFPAPTNAVNVEFDYARQIRVNGESEQFPLPSIYESMVFDFMMFRAYSKDGQNDSELGKSNQHLQLFQLALTGKTSTDNAERQRIASSERRR
ncbi:DUF6682 family protein [Enterovibrio sp. 27052020O]|uniref:phage adaptor protein n=1 Tax=Enterovibrio sp. 27052020O TaxID=3241166 RepID=UPI00388FF1CD